jgi:hypothetical protein
MDDLREGWEDFRVNFRTEMGQLRNKFQQDKLDGNLGDYNVVAIHDSIESNRGDEEYHEKQLDFHRDYCTNRIDKGEFLDSEYYEGGN